MEAFDEKVGPGINLKLFSFLFGPRGETNGQNNRTGAIATDGKFTLAPSDQGQTKDSQLIN